MQASKLKRPSLLWLSREDITRVRNQIIKLYLGPGETIRTAPPKGIFGIAFIEISCRGGLPSFEFDLRAGGDRDAHYQYWLRCNSDKSVSEGARGPNPFWDCRMTFRTESPEIPDLGEPEQLDFNDIKAYVPAMLVKHFSRHFPFVATDNFLQNNGELIG